MKITFRFILCVFHASSVPSVVKQNVIYRKNDGKKVLKTAIVFYNRREHRGSAEDAELINIPTNILNLIGYYLTLRLIGNPLRMLM